MLKLVFFSLLAVAVTAQTAPRPRARDIGLKVGVLPTGALNAITDVSGVLVGQTTIVRGDNVRTGVTAVLPHGGNLYREKVPGAVFLGNAFGKSVGTTQVEELGDIETPILLTCTTCVFRVADAVIDYMFALPGNEDVRSINPVVGETNDGTLSDIRSRPVTRDDVFAAIKNAKSGAVEEGAVGAGTGTVAFGWKGGIGTSSRKLPAKIGGYTVGVLVQTNFGGILQMGGAPVGQELGMFYLKDAVSASSHPFAPNAGAKRVGHPEQNPDGSCMIVVATDAPLDARNLKRLAARAIMGLARTGSSGSNGSGDYVIAFSTEASLRVRQGDSERARQVNVLGNDAMSPLFEAVIEATEEAIYNSMLKATTMTGNGHTIEALPVDRVAQILKNHKAIP